MLVQQQFRHEASLSEQCEPRPTVATLCGSSRLQAILGVDQDGWQTKHAVDIALRQGLRAATKLTCSSVSSPTFVMDSGKGPAFEV
jgi:hypothetical protein